MQMGFATLPFFFYPPPFSLKFTLCETKSATKTGDMHETIFLLAPLETGVSGWLLTITRVALQEHTRVNVNFTS